MLFAGERSIKAVEVILWAYNGSDKSRRDFIKAPAKVVKGSLRGRKEVKVQ